jgi:predicted TIM-barrel fold metal-dependent hydrolase
MIIDVHAHVVAGPEVGAYANGLLSGRGFHGKGHLNISDEQIRRRCDAHIASLVEVGTDLQLVSPRPYTMMHSAEPARIVQWYVESVNDLIARQVEMYPDKYVGVCGLAQSPSVEPAKWLDELERCIGEYNFVGCLLNPDPTEGQGTMPSLGDPMWYPVYERLCEMDVTALVHGAGCTITRESFHNHFITEESIAIMSLMRSEVFEHFPNLKLIIAHAGGSVPLSGWPLAGAQPLLGRRFDSV